jgi:hypothetical protein
MLSELSGSRDAFQSDQVRRPWLSMREAHDLNDVRC